MYDKNEKPGSGFVHFVCPVVTSLRKSRKTKGEVEVRTKMPVLEQVDSGQIVKQEIPCLI